MHIIEVHRFADEETGGVKGVAGMEFGILGFEDKEMRISFIAEDTPSVWKPSHLYPVAFLQVIDMNTLPLKSGALDVCARGKGSKVRLPVSKAEKLRKQAERCAARRVRSVNITP